MQKVGIQPSGKAGSDPGQRPVLISSACHVRYNRSSFKAAVSRLSLVDRDSIPLSTSTESLILQELTMGILDILEQILTPPAGEEKSSGGRAPSGAAGGRRAELPRLDPVPAVTAGGGIGSILPAVVQIVALRQGMLGGMSSAWTGSGTIVHPQGLILTNCHVANPGAMGMPSSDADQLAVAITERSDHPPALTWFASVVVYSAELDLAVLRIVSDVQGKPVSRLNLPFVPIGDSDGLDLGDRISIFGYPGIGGETVTFTSGSVSGFTSEERIRSPRAWIKTDATIAGGNSGGTAINEQGRLVGVPTQASAGANVAPVDARPVLDTNRDGRIDQRDTPMAVGGFINGLRPVNLAIPLLEKAGMKVDRERGLPAPNLPDSGWKPPQKQPDPVRSGRPRPTGRFSNLLFATEMTKDGRPINPVQNFPAGIPDVYATFEYQSMERGTPWSAVWMTGGQIIIEQKENWDQDEDGRKAVRISNRKGLPPGEYHLVLGIGPEVVLEGKIRVEDQIDDSDSEVHGQLVDDDSGKGVADGMVIVLKPRASLREFLETRDESMILTNADTDRNGKFVLPQQLAKGQSYSLIAAGRGYQPITVENALRLGPGAPEVADVGAIRMQRS